MTSLPAAAGAACRDPAPVGPMLVRIGLRVAGVSALIGLAMSLSQPTVSETLDNVLYSVCIGLSIFTLHSSPRFFEGGRRRVSTMRYHAVQAIVTIPLGFIVGVNVAALLRGRPLGLRAFGNVAPLAVIVTVVAGLGFMYYFWSTRRLADEAAARADALRTAAEAQLKLLQTQIEPHMLFNTLANLRTLIDVDPPRAQAMVDELIVYLRATLSASRSVVTTVAAEIEQLRAYLELMKVRMGERLRYVLDLPDALRDVAIPPMLLQPLVENAIRHGLEPKVAGGTIRVSVAVDASRLLIHVTDNGMGLDEAYSPGYGLAHVRERLATLHGRDAEVVMEPSPSGGVAVRIVMPLRRMDLA